GSLIEAIVNRLPAERIRLNAPAHIMEDMDWAVLVGKPDRSYMGGLVTTFRTRSDRDTIEKFDRIVIATSLRATKDLLHSGLGYSFGSLLPAEASSSILATMTWPNNLAGTFTIPPGFGFLVPQNGSVETCHSERSEGPASSTQPHDPPLLACTFVDQKFPHRAPPGARILRAFFGGASATALAEASNEAITHAALTQLRNILGPIPEPTHTEVRRWPHGLPQYEVGHLDRMAQLDEIVATIPGLHLLGNSYRGVGLPDLIHAARSAARTLTT
ncbi:MAG TPA: FAD-dependent oxidoreductase, partial [Acidobacteriaceae bacterium]|nr:FAD-dependent oxidoreductase [Acidobacteriaceae bacterium]